MDDNLNDLRRKAAEEGADSVQVQKDREFIAFATAMDAQQAHAKRVTAWADLIETVAMAGKAAVFVGLTYAADQAIRAWFG